jgi:hypothetical protein
MTRTTTFLRFPLAAACLSLLWSCGESSQAPSNVTVRDSLDVRIVEYAGSPAAAAVLRVDSVPVFRHGDEDGEYAFLLPVVGALQPDGGAVVYDGAINEIVLLAPDGSLRSILAAAGQGPGEVRMVLSLHVLGLDTILVEDDGNGRFTFFEQGTVARTVSGAGDRSVTRDLMAQGLAPDGSLLMSTSFYSRDFTEPWFAGQMVQWDLDAGAPDTVASYDMAPRLAADGSQNGLSDYGMLTVSGGRFVHGRTDIPELRWRDADGTVHQILRWSPSVAFPTDEVFEAFIEALRAYNTRINPGTSGNELEAFLDRVTSSYRMDPDDPLPLFGELFGDDQGRVWVAEYSPFPRVLLPDSYTLIDSDGTWVGTLQLPVPLRVLDVFGDLILGIQADELGVESVSAYRFGVEPLD